MTRLKLALAFGWLLITGGATMAQTPAFYQTPAYQAYNNGYSNYSGSSSCGYGGCRTTPVSYARPLPAYSSSGYRTAYAAADLRPSLSYGANGVSSCQTTPYTPYQASAYGNVGSNYYVGRNLIGEPKLFGRNEPIRNAFRFVFP